MKYSALKCDTNMTCLVSVSEWNTIIWFHTGWVIGLSRPCISETMLDFECKSLFKVIQKSCVACRHGDPIHHCPMQPRHVVHYSRKGNEHATGRGNKGSGSITHSFLQMKNEKQLHCGHCVWIHRLKQWTFAVLSQLNRHQFWHMQS